MASSSAPLVPSLFSLSARATEAIVESQVKDFYRSHPAATATKDSFCIPSPFSRLCRQLFYKAPEDPLNEYIRRIPPGFVPLIQNPHLLAKHIRVSGPSDTAEVSWEAVCKKRLPDLSARPSGLSWEQTFYSHQFQKSLIEAFGEFSRLPPDIQAFYFENRDQVHALHFSGCSVINDNQVNNLSEMFSVLHYLHIENCPNVTGASVKKLMTAHPELQHVQIKGNIAVGNEALQTAARHCSKLETLHLSTLRNDVTNKTLLDLVHNNPGLKEIELGRFDRLDDETLADIIVSCPDLRTLKVHDCRSLTPRFFDLVFTRTSHLKEMHITRCAGFKDAAVEDGEEHYSLDRLQIQECHGLSDEGMERIRQKFPYIETEAIF
jgi:hypothetical protein